MIQHIFFSSTARKQHLFVFLLFFFLLFPKAEYLWEIKSE